MKFIKRLIILSGERNKGTLTFEKNAYGIFAKLNIYGAPLSDPYLCMVIDGKKFGNPASGVQFSLSGPETIEIVHAAVFAEGKAVMYGTNAQKRMLPGEISRLKPPAPKKTPRAVQPELSLPDGEIFSTRKPKENTKPADGIKSVESRPAPPIETVKPRQSTVKDEYIDDAIADVNYFDQPFASGEIDDGEVKEILRRVAAAAPDAIIETVTLDVAYVPPPDIVQAGTTQAEALEVVHVIPDLQTGNIKETVEVSGDYVSPQALAFSYIMSQSNLVKLAPATDAEPENTQTTGGYSQDIQMPAKEVFAQEVRQSSEAQQEPVEETLEQQVPDPEVQKNAEKKSGNSLKRAAAGGSRKTEKVAPIGADKRVKARGGTFYERNGEEIERLFSGEREKDLENLLPNSKWVKIDYNGTGKYYVIGLIGKEYLCYGVPAAYTPVPPKELNGYCWWFPVKPHEPQGRGYWIMYQNLTTGEAIFPPKE